MNVTVITGGNRGIGRACALRFAKLGPVVIVGRDGDSLNQVCKEIRAAGGTAEWLVSDVTLSDSAKTVRDFVEARGWKAQNLVLSAGISKSGPTPNFDEGAWEEIFSTNVDAAFHFVREFLPQMVTAKSGTIFFLAGTAGIQGYRNMAAYCASKHALIGFAKALALEVGSKGINIVPLCPGPTDTNMTDQIVAGLVAKGLSRSDAQDKIAKASGQEHLLPPEEIAEVAATIAMGAVKLPNGEPVVIGEKIANDR